MSRTTQGQVPKTAVEAFAAAADELMSVKGLADFCQVPEKTVYAWLHAGTAPRSYRVGKYRRFKRSEVMAWLETRAS